MFLVLICYIGNKPTHHIKILNKPMTFACLWFMYVKLVCVLIVCPYWASLLGVLFIRPQWCRLSVRSYCSSILYVLNVYSSMCVFFVIAFYASLRVLILGLFCASSLCVLNVASLLCILNVFPRCAPLTCTLIFKIISFATEN